MLQIAFWPLGILMKKQYLHLSVFRCDNCQGPVVAASLGVRENEISKETDKQEIGAMCLACGHKQIGATQPGIARHFPPTEWAAANTVDPSGWVDAANFAVVRIEAAPAKNPSFWTRIQRSSRSMRKWATSGCRYSIGATARSDLEATPVSPLSIRIKRLRLLLQWHPE
jgi:hypothetical protein